VAALGIQAAFTFHGNPILRPGKIKAELASRNPFVFPLIVRQVFGE